METDSKKTGFFNLTRKSATVLFFAIILLFTAIQMVWHVMPRTQTEQERCRALLVHRHIEKVYMGKKELFVLRDTTSRHTAVWVNKYRLVPSCHGRLVSNYVPSKGKDYKKTEIDSIVGSMRDSLETDLKMLGSVSDELNYFLSVHGVQDEGYDMVISDKEHLNSLINERRKALDRLKDITDSSSVRIVKSDVFTVVWHDHENVVRKKQCLPVGRVSDKRLMYQTLDKTMPIGIRPKYYGVSDLSQDMISSVDTINRTFVRLARRGVGQAFLPKKIYDFTVDGKCRQIVGEYMDDTLSSGIRYDSLGVYRGEMDRNGLAQGHGTYFSTKKVFYEGHWMDDRRSGFGIESSPAPRVRAGEWLADIYKGERLNYTSDRIYGIDISRYQHEIGKKKYGIDWSKLRITQLGQISKKRISGVVDYPVAFVYIKSTEGTTVNNKYYLGDYAAARRHGKRVGTYHFFSTRSSGKAQAIHFLNNSRFHKGDFPPVLDVEPTHAQIMAMGGVEVMFSHIRTWMNMVENATKCRPVLYVGQSFVNRYLDKAPDIKKKYNVWIARYGEYKPDVHLVYWQLSPDGRVNGIHGDVDINVFNGYMPAFRNFLNFNLVP